MTDDSQLSRRFFLRGVLLAGVASLVGIDEAEARSRHHKRRRHIQHVKHWNMFHTTRLNTRRRQQRR